MRGIFRFLCSGLTLCLLQSLVEAQVALPVDSPNSRLGERAFYGWQGNTQRLYLSEESFGVTFREGTHVSEIEYALDSEIAVSRVTAERLLQEMDSIDSARSAPVGVLDKERTVLLKVTPGVSVAGIMSSMARLQIKDPVVRVNPAFKVGVESGDNLLTNLVYVTVSSSHEVYAYAEKQFAAEGLRVYRKYDYSRIGKMGYHLEIPDPIESGIYDDAIDVANRLHELPFTLNAAPSFIPLYSGQTSAIPNDPYFARYAGGSTTPAPPAFPLPHGPNHEGHWWLEMMNLPDAWEEIYGNTFSGIDSGPEVVVAVLDDGVAMDYDGTLNSYGNRGLPAGYSTTGKFKIQGGELGLAGHIDLNPNQWLNLAEANAANTSTTGHGKDDDGNGLIDDYFGWDFVGDDPAVYLEGGASVPGDNIPYPDFGDQPIWRLNRAHGHAAASTVAARVNNNTLMSGVCPDCKIMALRYHVNVFLGNTTEVYYVAHPIDAIHYAAGMPYGGSGESGTKADIIAFMFGTETYDPGLENAIQYARSKDIPIFLPAGNNNDSLDSRPYFPQVFPEVICVGALNRGVGRFPPGGQQQWFGNLTNMSTRRAHFPNPIEYPGATGDSASNFGWPVDLVTPSITERQVGDYLKMNATISSASGIGDGGGTSSAMPQAAGVGALLKKVDPDISAAEIQAILQWTAKDIVYNYTNPEGQNEIAGPGRDRFTGHGLIDAHAAVLFAKRPKWRLTDASDGKFLLSIYEGGYMALDGVIAETGSTDPSGLLNDDPAKPDMILKTSGGQNLARLVRNPVGTTPVATLYIRGAYRSFLDDLGLTVSSLGEPGSKNIRWETEAGDIDAFIDAQGNLDIRGKGFLGGNPDPKQTFRVGFATDPSVELAFQGTDAIQKAINAWPGNTNGPSGTELKTLQGYTIPSGSVIEVWAQGGGGHANPFSAIKFPSGGSAPVRNLTIRSRNPNDWNVVRSTVIQSNGTSTTHIPVVEFAGAETEDAAIIGFTLRGGTGAGAAINGNHTLARVIGNFVYGNQDHTVLLSKGGTITAVHGLIQGNVIGKASSHYPTTWGTNANFAGGALNQCDGVIKQNIVWYNTNVHPSAQALGGGITWCDGLIVENIVANNQSELGGGMAFEGDHTPMVQGNIIYGNSAVDGGGIYVESSVARIENNTIYGNVANTGMRGGVYYSGTDGASDGFFFQNNVVWQNTGAPAVGSQISTNIRPFYCAIEVNTVPALGTGNIGPWTGSGVVLADLKFASTTLFPGGGATPDFRNFLHIQQNTSKLIDAGNHERDAYDSSNYGSDGIKEYVFTKDFDDELSPIDIPGKGTEHLDPTPIPNHYSIPLDIGADEFPTEPGGQGFSIWWETRQFNWSSAP